MKKIVSLTLVTALLFSFAACGGGSLSTTASGKSITVQEILKYKPDETAAIDETEFTFACLGAGTILCIAMNKDFLFQINDSVQYYKADGKVYKIPHAAGSENIHMIDSGYDK